MSALSGRSKQRKRTPARPGSSRAAPSRLRAESSPYGRAWLRIDWAAVRRIATLSGCRQTEPPALRSARTPPGRGRRMRLGGSQRHHQWLSNTRTCESPTGLQGRSRWTPSKQIFTVGRVRNTRPENCPLTAPYTKQDTAIHITIPVLDAAPRSGPHRATRWTRRTRC